MNKSCKINTNNTLENISEEQQKNCESFLNRRGWLKQGKNNNAKIEGNVILLNKLFLGDWLDQKGNIGHEIIDFLLTDNNEYYVYNNPWGVCPDDIWVEGTKNLRQWKKEKYLAKYLVLTSGLKNNNFNILYVVELEEKIHRFHTVSKKSNNSSDNTEQYHRYENFKCAQKALKQFMQERKIVYNGKYLYEIYKDNDSLYLTFKAKKIYKANEEIPVSNLIYNFQRNKGYLFDDKNKNDYEFVNNLILTSIENKKLIEFNPKTVKEDNIRSLKKQTTFLDLIAFQDNEQAFTNMFYSILSFKDLIKKFCITFQDKKIFDKNSDYEVFKEYVVENGRLDIYARGSKQNIIIENKIRSGLNGINSEDKITQLSTYYKWANKVDSEYEPLFFIIAPNFRILEIKNEIEKLDPKMKNIYKIISYKEIADFIENEYKNQTLDKTYEFYNLIPQIIIAFNNLTHETKEDQYARMFLNNTK
ncbi:PD-(D/E)XK nuclease family protein [Mycoplasma zalophi]|uniref:PD-(D/E)XK nuclease family protein n=1 Tax=Mycoplasma zalophi TaxID=191287 RepID=A0ABS6DPF1_9MOLU|nr:PD-(D/E)XK nuclease family protein [Mycoplasma zalophi]MBU4691024.1 PD-(D/E)XK nuclease family protein [Mycoplasma zalophi]MBU4692197.1 PD-(D/E)XK nuclease family protein [Mycoplasma zalophi]